MTSDTNSRTIQPAMENAIDAASLKPTRHRTSRRAVNAGYTPALTHALTADRSECWAFWPLAMERIRRFDTLYASEMDVEAFIRTLTAHFVSGSPLIRVWIAASDNGDIVAHMVATIERRPAKPPVAFVWQFEVDVPLSRRERLHAFDELTRWAVECGAEALELWTAHNPVLWTRTYGFVPHRTIMRRTL
jgi:hypothetical protein